MSNEKRIMHYVCHNPACTARMVWNAVGQPGSIELFKTTLTSMVYGGRLSSELQKVNGHTEPVYKVKK